MAKSLVQAYDYWQDQPGILTVYLVAHIRVALRSLSSSLQSLSTDSLRHQQQLASVIPSRRMPARHILALTNQEVPTIVF